LRALILVGGEGTRLRPLTNDIPKQMLPVVEIPMIERVVAHLVTHGVTDVVLSLGYRPDQFIAGYPDSRCAGATLTYVVEPSLMDTAGAVRYAATRAGIDKTFLVLNGDVLSDLDFSSLVAFHRRTGAEGTISLTPVEDPSAFGVVPTAEDGRVIEFIEKPPRGTESTNMINAGAYVLEPSVLDRIPDGVRVNIERETFPAMVADGSLYALASNGYWLDVGTPDRFLDASTDLLDGRRPGAPVAGAREVTAGVWHMGRPEVSGPVSAPAFVGEGARVTGSIIGAVIGANASVGDGAVVRRTVIMKGASVGAGATVVDSIIGPDATIGAGACLQSTVVGVGAVVAEGAIHDGERVPA
jgi:mannose-1-phosphate guanylyltransferase